MKYLVAQQKCDVNSRDKQGVCTCPLGYTAYCVMKEVTVMSPLNCFHDEPRSEHVNTAKFLLNKEETCVTSDELFVLGLPVYCDSKFPVFFLMESTLKHKLGSNSTDLHCEIAKCLEIAIAESKWGFAEQVLCAYAIGIKTAMTSDSVQTSGTPNCFIQLALEVTLSSLRFFCSLTSVHQT